MKWLTTSPSLEQKKNPHSPPFFPKEKYILALEGIACFPPSKKIHTHPALPPDMLPSQNKKPLAPRCILSLLIKVLAFTFDRMNLYSYELFKCLHVWDCLGIGQIPKALQVVCTYLNGIEHTTLLTGVAGNKFILSPRSLGSARFFYIAPVAKLLFLT
jgi:hypothetical protein